MSKGGADCGTKIYESLGKKIDYEFEKEYAELKEAGNEFSPELDARLFEAARFYEKKYAAGQKKIKNYQILKKAAVFLLVLVSANAVAMGTSQAYRQFVFQVFENKDNNSITIHDSAMQDMIDSWDDYWYPTYLPDGYRIVAAEESPVKCLLIQVDAVEECLLITEYPQGAELSYDTAHSQISDIQIHNYIGKRIAFEDHTRIVYPTETNILEFRFDSSIPEQEVVKIAEKMEYVNPS